ncbi:hypothetical protein [Candidatus Nitrospira nitrificans]|uniref:Transposase n=1 Tax=Candidatus Nitrospira nitrificans TaxID=1742973 RepID=A0A0S4L9D8_9BACT
MAWATDEFGGTKLPLEAPKLKTIHAKIWQLAKDVLEGSLIKAAC